MSENPWETAQRDQAAAAGPGEELLREMAYLGEPASVESDRVTQWLNREHEIRCGHRVGPPYVGRLVAEPVNCLPCSRSDFQRAAYSATCDSCGRMRTDGAVLLLAKWDLILLAPFCKPCREEES